ncbi:JmjC domain-containing protein [Streptomyces olivaceus]|uniref:JmjC domain-containing protein n=1 Tax=Streptomyces olivaceus TaxID=47716 RepID=UPI0018859BB4|nr:cupin domain-containing protein [Streptomyces olivaceus]
MESARFELPYFDIDIFFSQYWRKRPLYVPQGAREFLGYQWTIAEFEAAEAAARRQAGRIKEREGEVTFIEQVSSCDDRLRESAQVLQVTFGAPQVWFDAIRTYSGTESPNGIGAHFDHSDNFVLQQSGVKKWTLAAPENIDPETIKRRMLNLPGPGGDHTLPDGDCLAFTVGPGDLLYIPIFWLHSGVSQGDSLSISLVCPAVSLYSAVLPLLAKVVRSQAIGHQPIPALHSGLNDQQRTDTIEAVAKATRTLMGHLTDEALVRALLGAQSDYLARL